MPLRLLRYVLRILERHVAGKPPPAALPLPLVIPVVLHHSESGWNVARCLEDLFDNDLVSQANVQHLVPRLGFVLDDLSGVPDKDLEARALGLIPALTLWALRDSRNPTRLVMQRLKVSWTCLELRLSSFGRSRHRNELERQKQHSA